MLEAMAIACWKSWWGDLGRCYKELYNHMRGWVDVVAKIDLYTSLDCEFFYKKINNIMFKVQRVKP